MKRNWCFTSFAEPHIPVDHKHFRYACYQKERCPETQRIHYQGYIEFSQGIKLAPLKTAFGDDTIHFEGRKGTAEQARNYCMKEESRLEEPKEFGVFEKNQGHRSDLDDFAKAVMEGKKDWELAESHPVSFLKFAKHADRLRLAKKPVARDPPQVFIRWGDPGAGKTRYIYDTHPLEDIFLMDAQYKWFDGYMGQSVVLFDDFEGQFRLSFLLQLLDRYPMRVPIKGGFVQWTPQIIYITANTPPEHWYYDQLQIKKDALMRRVTQVEQIFVEHGVVNE